MLVDITSLLEKIATDNIDIESIFWKLSPIELEVLALGCSLDTAIESLSLELKLDSLARAELSEFDRKLLARHGDSCIRVEWMDWEGSSYVQKSQQFIDEVDCQRWISDWQNWEFGQWGIGGDPSLASYHLKIFYPDGREELFEG